MATNPDVDTDVPREVEEFLSKLNQALEKGSTGALNELYEEQFDTLTKEIYIVGPGQVRSWPSPSLPQVTRHLRSKTAQEVYKFLFHKHLFTDSRSIKATDASSAWSNFKNLFQLTTSGEVQLPNWMLWDIFDEFTFQLSAVYSRHFVTAEEWSVPETLKALDDVIERSGIIELCKSAQKMDEVANKSNGIALSGFFAVITKVKLNVLLGDYYAALSAVQPLDVYGNSSSVLQKVGPANISLFFHIGFSYLMIHRFEDASRAFRRCTNAKASGRKFSERVQRDAATLYVCACVLGGMFIGNVSLPGDQRRKDNFEDEKETLRNGDEERFREVFDRCSPKFITVPNSSSMVKGTEGKELQTRMFRRAVQQQQDVIRLRGYFGVYQNAKLGLLETLLDTNDGYAPLFALKMRSRQLVHDGKSSDLLSGDFRVSAQYDCIITDDNVDVIACTNPNSMESKLLGRIKAVQREEQKHEAALRQEEANQNNKHNNNNRDGQGFQQRRKNGGGKPAPGGAPRRQNTNAGNSGAPRAAAKKPMLGGGLMDRNVQKE